MPSEVSRLREVAQARVRRRETPSSFASSRARSAMVFRISSGSSFEAVAGYSRALVVEHDGWAEVHISGVTGFNYATMTIDEDQAVQTRQCFATIAKALAEAGFALADVVRARYYIVDPADAERVLKICGEMFAKIWPAATLLVVAALLRPEMKVEIEITAKRTRQYITQRTQ